MKINVFECLLGAVMSCLVALVSLALYMVLCTGPDTIYIEIEKPCPNEIPSDKLPWWLDPERKVEC